MVIADRGLRRLTVGCRLEPYTVVVVDSTDAPWPAAYELTLSGMPSWMAFRWAFERLAMSHVGLLAALVERRN